MELNLTQLLAQQSARPETAAPAQDQAPGGAPSSPFADYSFFIMIAGVFVFMYFFIIRPQRKEEKRKKEMLGALKKGDQVVTSSGIIGTVHAVKDETVTLNLGDNTRVEFLRSAVGSVRNQKGGDTAANAEKSGKKDRK